MEDAATLRGSLFVDITRCEAGLACGANDDVCDPGPVDPLPIHEQFQTDCEAVLTACGAEPQTIGDACGTDPGSDMAEELAWLGTDVVDGLFECLGLTCENIVDCIDDAVEL